MRPKKKRFVGVRMSEDLHQQLENKAQELSADPSRLIRLACRVLLVQSDTEIRSFLREEVLEEAGL